MSKYPNITFTLTIDNEENSLKVQATCDEMSKEQILSSIEILKQKIISGELETPDAVEKGGYYLQETFPLEEIKVETDSVKSEYFIQYIVSDRNKFDFHSCSVILDVTPNSTDIFERILDKATLIHNSYNSPHNIIKPENIIIKVLTKLS